MNSARSVAVLTESSTGRAVCCAFCLGVGLWVQGELCAAGEAPELVHDARPVITSIRQYWDLPADQKSQPCPLKLDCFVTYFDPAWRLLFVQDKEGIGAYVPYGNNPFPFKSGQRILATGRLVPPSLDISFEHAEIALLERAWPEALQTAGKITESGRFITRLVTVEGLVDRLRRLAPHHVQLTLAVEGQSVVVWIKHELTDPLPDLNNVTVRVEGVYNPKIGPDGRMSALEIMVPDVDHLTVVGRLEDDPRFKLPIVPISSIIGRPIDQLVRVVGLVKAQESGRFVRIRDDTGQVDILTGQSRTCALNDRIEAVGYPLVDGTQWQLARGLFRAAPDSDATPATVATGPPKLLRLAVQVLELSPDEAAESRPVWLTGVVTWSHPSSPFFFIQDSTGGVCIMRDKSDSPVRSIGRYLEVHGVTGMGRFAPVVKATRFDKVSEMVLPVARQVSLEHALTGAEEAQWVEMRGYLRQIRRRDGWNELELATAAGDFLAVLPAEEDVGHMIGSSVRLHGVCTASATDQRKLTGIRLWVPSANHVQVEEPAPKDLFEVPVRSLSSLGQFGGLQSFSHRLRVSGVVLHHTPGHVIYLQEGNDSLMIFSREREVLRPGDRIEAVGFLARQGSRVTLREAVYRKSGHIEQPEPHKIVSVASPVVSEDGRLVSLEGDLIDNSAAGDEINLTLQNQNVIFEAILDKTSSANPFESVAVGSRLALTGVYLVKYDEYGEPASFQLRLRTVGDVAVLKSPSWMTPRRITFFAGTLGFGILVFMAWVTALRRRVKIQTKQIREQLERELWLKGELHRASKLDSLGLLAGGIAHDFNNLLTVMMGNISLAGYDSNLTAETVESLRSAEQAAVRARDLTQQLLTFAKGGAPLRVAVSLPEVVQEVTEFALRGSNIRCEFDQPVDLWPANVDKGQIAQVVQNIVINALQAMPTGGVIDISLCNETVGNELGQVLAPGRYVKLSIADHGPGIAPENLPKIFDPYFTTKKQGNGLGLATVHSIIKKHLGHITAESKPGRGTTFQMWLPAADVAPAADSTPPIFHPIEAGQISVHKKQVRVLFMDDEAGVRSLGQMLLKRMGHAVTAVSDGAEALREYERARQDARPYDLVILDLTIPGGMGGRETMEKLLLIDPAVKAIVSSGYSNDLVLSNYQAHGFRGMVSKPYDVTDLAHAVDQVLKGERA